MGSGVTAPRLRNTSSIVVVHGLSCTLARGIIQDQGSNPCLLHWQMDLADEFFITESPGKSCPLHLRDKIKLGETDLASWITCIDLIYSIFVAFHFWYSSLHSGASHVALVVKNLSADAGDINRCRFDPWVGKISYRRNGNPRQYSCLENPTDIGTWQDRVHKLAKSRTQLKWLSMDTVSVWMGQPYL